MDNFKLISCLVYMIPPWDHNVRQIDPVQIHRSILILSAHVRLGQTRLFPSSFSSTTILCVFLNSPFGATRGALLTLLCLITSNSK